jgi:hypothetical protein
MKAILVNPFDRTITEVEYSGDFKQIYNFIDAECFDCARINRHGDGIFVDDEGLIREVEQAFFQHEDYPQPLAGKGLVLGCDDEGNSVSPHTTLEELKAKITFGSPVAFADGGYGWIEHA